MYIAEELWTSATFFLFKQDQMNLDLWPREKAIKSHDMLQIKMPQCHTKPYKAKHSNSKPKCNKSREDNTLTPKGLNILRICLRLYRKNFFFLHLQIFCSLTFFVFFGRNLFLWRIFLLWTFFAHVSTMPTTKILLGPLSVQGGRKLR